MGINPQLIGKFTLTKARLPSYACSFVSVELLSRIIVEHRAMEKRGFVATPGISQYFQTFAGPSTEKAPSNAERELSKDLELAYRAQDICARCIHAWVRAAGPTG